MRGYQQHAKINNLNINHPIEFEKYDNPVLHKYLIKKKNEIYKVVCMISNWDVPTICDDDNELQFF